jgi:hypothetical protein
VIETAAPAAPAVAHDELTPRVISALIWIAAFCFAVGIFLSATLLLRELPPTAPVAIGRVTVEKVSKARDYATEVLFFLLVPLATIGLYRVGARENERVRARLAGRRHAGDTQGLQNLASLLFVTPFFLAPFLYLTTFKWGWPLLIPIALSQLAPRALFAFEENRWLRSLLSPALVPFHTLILVEAFSWIVFRYVSIAKRIAHVPTLFLEVVFIAFFLLIFWLAFVLMARLASFTLGVDTRIALQRLSVAALPLVLLAPAAVLFFNPQQAIVLVLTMTFISMAIALRSRDPIEGRHVRNALAYAILPIMLYAIAYASTASLAQWIDLFHRGEAMGPASDYLRGKVPFRDVFVLHGLMEDGMLDAWLMQLFGRNLSIALARPVILGAFAVPALWFVGMALFDSIPLALVVVFLDAVTTVDNERAFFEIVVLAFLFAGVRRGGRDDATPRDRRVSALLIALAGMFAGIALFFSYDIGMYAIGGSLLFLVALLLIASRVRLAYRARFGSVVAFVVGTAAGMLPFLIFLASRGAIGAFLETSFVTLPRIIDAVWSLPFPDLASTFRNDLNLHTISDFFLYEKFRFTLNPLVISIGLIALLCRLARKSADRSDVALMALLSFAILTQRSALGRADFPHQYFSAFLIGPILIVLLSWFGRMARDVWRRGDRPSQAFLIISVVAILPLFIVAFWIPDIVNMRLDDTIRYIPRVTTIGYSDSAAEEVQNRIHDVQQQVEELAPKNAPIFDFSNQPAFYFFCNRPNPTRFYQVPILSPREHQLEALRALDRHPPAVVIRQSPQEFDLFDGIDNVVRAQAVAAYIDDHYVYARTVRGVELWRPKRDAKRVDVANYMRFIHVPTLEQLGEAKRSKMVLPSVGSLPGANGTFWVSDLLLQNPYSTPLTVSLRYVASDTRLDRRITINPGQSARWPDVVKTLFHAYDGLGALWIEYRGTRAPIARVKTHDVAHDSRASLDSPLSTRDAATANTDTSELTLVGFRRASASRRVNVGVLNVGITPATFRITVRDAHGRAIGKAYEQGLPEEENFLLADVERQLGATIDENRTVQVSMIAGTGIAYATAIDSELADSEFFAAVPTQKK